MPVGLVLKPGRQKIGSDQVNVIVLDSETRVVNAHAFKSRRSSHGSDVVDFDIRDSLAAIARIAEKRDRRVEIVIRRPTPAARARATISASSAREIGKVEMAMGVDEHRPLAGVFSRDHLSRRLQFLP
jgi:hypothetical protein